MRKSVLTIAALLIGTVAAAAQDAPYYEAQCDAPVVTIGDTFDRNPVVNVNVLYAPSTHQWNVFHTLASGYVVERSEQYTMADASFTSPRGARLQWEGVWNKNRNITMVGELSRDQVGIVYTEKQYDRNRGLVMQMATHCVQIKQEAPPVVAYAPPPAPALRFIVPRDVSGGYMNMRNGPGVNHGLTGAIPAGMTVTASRCVPRDDRIAGADWCLVNWNGASGWVSQAGLMPIDQGYPGQNQHNGNVY